MRVLLSSEIFKLLLRTPSIFFAYYERLPSSSVERTVVMEGSKKLEKDARKKGRESKRPEPEVKRINA